MYAVKKNDCQPYNIEKRQDPPWPWDCYPLCAFACGIDIGKGHWYWTFIDVWHSHSYMIVQSFHSNFALEIAFDI